MKDIKTVSIIGYGRFGKTLGRLLGSSEFSIKVFDTDKAQLVDTDFEICSDLKEAYESEVIFIATPISLFEEIIKEHKQYFKDQLIIDTLSVKVHPANILKNELRETNVRAILTHPMFGPDSSKNGFENLPIVVSNLNATDEEYKYWQEIFSNAGLLINEMTPEEHDKSAADSQGLTHFIGRMVSEFGKKPTTIDTLGSKELQKIMENTCNDTWELFNDLQTYNPYTKEMRVRVGNAFDNTYNKLLPKRISREKIIFGIQGGEGSFNHQALLDYTSRHDISKYEIKYLHTTKRVLTELHAGNIDYGQFAIHNSIGGVVEETIHAMGDFKFNITEEFAIQIKHFMMKPHDVDISEINTIMTHPQVLKQCKTTLEQKYPNYEKTSGEGDLIDHAAVAKAMGEGNIDKNITVMGPEGLSELFNLEIIDKNLQDDNENWTSFLMTERK